MNGCGLNYRNIFCVCYDAMKFELSVPVSHVLASESSLVLALGSAITSQLSTLVVSVLLFQFWVTHNRAYLVGLFVGKGSGAKLYSL